MRLSLVIASLIAAAPVLAQQPALPEDVITAEDLPSITGVAQLPGELGGGPEIPLDVTEREAVKILEEWTQRRLQPGMAENGGVLYVYGAGMPKIVCRPLHACDVALQAGEIVNDVDVGDKARWTITPAVSGGNGKPERVHLNIKPHDTGLVTNATVTTDRRTYHLALKSSAKHNFHAVRFIYPEDALNQWRELRARQLKDQAQTVAELPGVDPTNHNFAYSVEANGRNWAPIRVFDNGEKTYFQLRSRSPVLPALFMMENGKQKLINYRPRNGYFIVDRIADEFVMVYGPDNDKVIIRRGEEQVPAANQSKMVIEMGWKNK
jgi:type IV secretion system protein VirB9